MPIEVQRAAVVFFFRFTAHDAKTQTYKTTLRDDNGEFQRLDNNTIVGVCLNEEYEITEDQPLSAKVTIETSTRVARKETGAGQDEDLFDTFVKTKSVLSADEGHFYSKCEIKAWCGNEIAFENVWNKSIPRFNV